MSQKSESKGLEEEGQNRQESQIKERSVQVEPIPEIAPTEAVVKVVRQELRHYQQSISTTPPASEMEGWEGVLEGSADRILTMAEEAQKHNMEMDKEDLLMEKDDRKVQKEFLAKQMRLFSRTQIIACCIIVMSLICGTIVASWEPKAGSAIIISTLTMVTGAFAWSKWVGRISIEDFED